MYSVKVWINTDDDFGYDDSEFFLGDEHNDTEHTFYFEEREEAVEALIRSFHNLKNTLRPCGRDNIERWINSMDQRIELICRKFKTFTIEKCFGNQDIIYELLGVEKVGLPNGSYTYISPDPDMNFSWYEEEEILWDEVVKMPDVINKED